jgi:hypothetical protein
MILCRFQFESDGFDTLMKGESFSAIFDDFVKANSNILYQFSLGASCPIELKNISRPSHPNPDSEPSVPPLPPKPPKEKQNFTDEEVDSLLIALSRRTKQTLHSDSFEKYAARRSGRGISWVRQRISELETAGLIAPNNVQ